MNNLIEKQLSALKNSMGVPPIVPPLNWHSEWWHGENIRNVNLPQAPNKEVAFPSTSLKGVEGKVFLSMGWGNGEPVVLATIFLRNFSLTKR